MCIFCDIVEGKIPSSLVYEDDKVYCFDDINPASPVHVLVIPKKHYDDILAMSNDKEEGALYMKAILETINKVSEIKGLSNGFRIINNCGEDGSQTVKHVHFHVLGGTKLTERIL